MIISGHEGTLFYKEKVGLSSRGFFQISTQCTSLNFEISRDVGVLLPDPDELLTEFLQETGFSLRRILSLRRCRHLLHAESAKSHHIPTVPTAAFKFFVN